MSRSDALGTWSSEAVVETYLGFFRSRGHRELPSSSLVPENDPTVLLTTAGMQQLIPYMLGRAAPPAPRLCSIQKCFRTTDVDSVGDLRHLTFFEMLGNFSIGDYFKDQMIPWAWELVTEGFHLPPERVWVTVHPTDDQSAVLWRSVGLPSERIVPDESNFWGPPGSGGPCGPDTELYFDRGPALGCGREGCGPGLDCCDRYLEFWNLVLMENFQDTDGTRTALAQKNIDTGLGLERMTAILEDVPSVYETDLFLPIIHGVEQLSGARYGADQLTDYGLRVLADHGRAIAFLVGDGVLPSNEGRGYVLRRILRRAVRYGRRLGLGDPFLGDLATLVIDRMGPRHPNLDATRHQLVEVVRSEEQRFAATLESGLSLLERWIEEIRAAGGAEFPGEYIFRLYDTYGFPRELSEEIVAEAGLTVPSAGFEQAMAAQRERSRGGARFGGERRLDQGGGLASSAPTVFVGYRQLEAQTPIVALQVDGSDAASLHAGQPGAIVLAETPFYPEGGGQVGDVGEILTGGGRFRVEDTQRDPAGHILHVGRVVSGELHPGDRVDAVVEIDRRRDIMRHHSVTHLLHKSLQQTLGPHAVQAGSLVAPHVARFDFHHEGPVGADRLEEVEDLVNRQILADLAVDVAELPFDQAIREGAMAFFGEKYGDRVRVVTMGDFSKELCGGTHVRTTGEMGAAYVLSETGIGSGMRRIEVVAGRVAHELARSRARQVAYLAERLEVPPDRVEESFDAMLAALRDARREASQLEAALAEVQSAAVAENPRMVEGIPVVTARFDTRSMDALLQVKDAIQRRVVSGVIVLGAVVEGKPQFVASVSRDLIRPGFDASVIVKDVAAVTGGGGGGRPDLARAGGRDPSKLDEALAQVESIVRARAGARG